MDSELEILIRAIADEKSADEATKQLVNRVFTKLKDGAIKLPINSKLDKSELKKLDDNVKKARKEVVDRYNRLQKEMANPEGFDAFSDKAINELVELGKAYANFNAKASKKGKNSTAAVSDVKDALGEVFQLYENELKLLNSKIKELNLQGKVAKPLSTTRPGRNSNKKQNEEAYNRYLAKQEQHSDKAKGAAKRKELYKELEEVRANKSPLPQRVIRGVATKQTLQETEYSGSYPSGFARQMARSRAEARKHELASLRVERNKQKAEKHADDLENGRVKYNAKERVETRHPDGKIDIDYKDTEVYNKKPKKYTNEENNALKRDVATNELAKILGGIEHQRKDVSVQLFKDYMTGAAAFNKASGENEWKVIQETLEKTLNRYRGDKGTLGITDGSKKGVFGGHQEAVAALQEMLAYLGELAKQSETESDISAEQARQLREMAKIDKKAANEYADELMGKPHYKKSNSTVEDNSQLAREIKNEITQVKDATDETFTAVRSGTKATESQTDLEKIENVRENVADSTENATAKLNSNINRDVAGAVKGDAKTGFNTDKKADAMINIAREILSNIVRNDDANALIDTTKKILSAITGKDKTKAKDKSVSGKSKTKSKNKNDIPDNTTSVVTDKPLTTSSEEVKPTTIELPANTKDLYAKLQDATRLALPKADRRRRKISKGLIDETPSKQLAVLPEMKALLDIGKPLKTLKEALNPSILDSRRWNREKIIEHGEARKKPLDTEKVIEAKAATSKLPMVIPDKGVETKKETIGLSKSDIIPMVKKSEVTSGMMKNTTIWDKLSASLHKATGATDDYTDVITSTAEKQDALAAERIKKFGLNNGRNPNDTGDIASIKRALELFRTNKRSIEDNPELAQNIRLTDGIKVDTSEVIAQLNKTLSGKQMRNAQMGGSIPRQVLGAMTGFVGMPSLEKSRAQADGLNQILGNINNALQSVLTTIQMKETELAGMEASGQAKFSADGRMVEGTSAAKKTLADLEESKLVLTSILADMGMVDEIVDKTGGKFSKLVKQLSFTSPVLRENNAILRNIGSGLDKNGKALKYQSRLAETLNYTFQLMSRSIGQMLKNWLVQLNPITMIKKAFQDFASYDPKWQRTMNVVKYNLRSIILPLMQKIAQLLVNMLGVVDIILQKVQAAFGQNPISLFDQENAKKFKDEVEEIKNITAGIDELHDIGGDPEKDPNDLTGEIYKPQLSEGWKKFAETLGDIFVGIGKAIQWCIDNWKLLAGLLAAYVVGKGLLNLITWGKNFGSLLSGLSLSSLISSIGIAIGAALTLYGIFQDIKLAQDWDQMTPEERTKTANKGDTSMGIGGGLIGAGAGWKLGGSALGAKLGLTSASGMAAGATFVGGIALGISGTANAITAATNGNFEMVQKESTKAGAGIGMAAGTAVGVGMAAAGTKIGAALGSWAGPVGAAVGAVVGAGLGWATGKVVTFFGDVGGEFSKLKISQDDLTWATDQYNTALGNEYQALQDLTGMEQATGQSGEDLYKKVENGTIKYSELTTEQKILLKAYEDYQDCLKTTADALKQQVDYENAILMTKAEESGDYSEFIASMQDATNKGIYSSEEMRDRLSQVYAELSSKEREVFLTQIPEDMRQGVEAGAYQYYSGWEKFKVNMSTAWESFKSGAAQLWEDVKTTAGEKWEGIKTTCGNIWEGMKTTAGNIWGGMKTTAGNIWNSIKIEAGEAWEGIKNSAVGQKVQEMATNVATKWNEMKIKAGETWENIKTKAGTIWENIKNSTIGQKVKSIWQDTTTKFNEIKTKLTESWNTLKTNAGTAWGNIKSSIVGAAKNAWEGAKGFFNNIADGVKKAWESLKELAKETGQKIGNFVSGNGWKTNAEVSNISYASYAVGTNYVPSDGFAYLHQGEAVIPKKYNQPYQQPQGLSSEEREYMSQMIQTMKSLDNTINQGIPVTGQFVQRGSDLVATVEKASNRISNNILNNKVYAR